MKTIILIASMLICSVIVSAQINPNNNMKKLIINEKVHFEDDSLTSCYVVIDESVHYGSSMTSTVTLFTYKNKNKVIKNKNYYLNVDEIPKVIEISLTNSLSNYNTKIAEIVKAKLLILNPTWNTANITIE